MSASRSRTGFGRSRLTAAFDEAAFKAAVHQHLVLEDFLSSTDPEFAECAAGRCPHGADVGACEYAEQRRETIGTVPRSLATDAGTALGLVRKYADWRERPAGWSWELTRAVNVAGAVEATYVRMKEKEAERVRRGNHGT